MNFLFSTPVWLTLMRSTALTRSSGVKNRAFAGESGKNNLFKVFKKGHSGPLVRSSSAQRKKTRRGEEEEWHVTHRKRTPAITVIPPKMMFSLPMDRCTEGGRARSVLLFDNKSLRKKMVRKRKTAHHCHGAKCVVLMWREPYANRPSAMIANPSMRTVKVHHGER